MSEITVNNTQELSAALKAAQDGDVISLTAGSYSGLDVSRLNFSTGVTITSADPSHLAVLTNFDISASSGLHFANLEFHATGAGGNYWGFNVNNSSNISFDHLSVHGSLDGNPQDDPEGIGILGSSNISITNSEFQQLFRGIAFGNTSGVTISGNSFHDLRTTGVMGAQASDVKILDNTFKNFKLVTGDHPDAIQFLTSATTAASHDITISGNVIDRGAGDGIQGIFLRDELGSLPYDHVTISDNLLIGTGYNGIAVLGGKDLMITGNTLVSYSGSSTVNWLLVQKADGVVAAGNSAVKISFDQVTNLVEANDTLNAAVADAGKAALAIWTFAHTGITPVIDDLGGLFGGVIPSVWDFYSPAAGMAQASSLAPGSLQADVIGYTGVHLSDPQAMMGGILE